MTEAKPEPEVAPEPVADPPAAARAADGEAEAGESGGQGPLPRLAGRTRNDPSEGRDEARRVARRRKRERCLA